jgi:hypothetical protein
MAEKQEKSIFDVAADIDLGNAEVFGERVPSAAHVLDYRYWTAETDGIERTPQSAMHICGRSKRLPTRPTSCLTDSERRQLHSWARRILPSFPLLFWRTL